MPGKPSDTSAVRSASGPATPTIRSGPADHPPAVPAFRKLDAVAVLTGPLLPAPQLLVGLLLSVQPLFPQLLQRRGPRYGLVRDLPDHHLTRPDRHTGAVIARQRDSWCRCCCTRPLRVDQACAADLSDLGEDSGHRVCAWSARAPGRAKIPAHPGHSGGPGGLLPERKNDLTVRGESALQPRRPGEGPPPPQQGSSKAGSGRASVPVRLIRRPWP